MKKIKERNGLAIGFLTDGNLNVKWANRLFTEIPKGIPSGTFWKYIWVEGKDYRAKGGYAKARNMMVKQAQKTGVKWLLMVDTDLFLPADTVTQLMACNKPIVTGVYYSKSMPPQPILYKKLGDGPYWDFPVDELFPVGAAGAGAVLIEMSVFDKFDEAGIPYFKENWTYTKSDGSKVNVNIGEDYFFFNEAKKLGIQPYCTSKVMCDHVDFNTGIAYPGDEEVNRIRRKILEKKGLTEVLDKEDKLFSVDKDKKTIVFYNNLTPGFDGNEIGNRPVGGAETCIINLSKCLAKDYNVFVINYCKNPGIYDGVKYVHLNDTDFLKNIKTDLFVALRIPPLIDFKEMYDIKRIVLWAHDFVACPCWDILPEAIDNIDNIVALSNWHKNNIKSRFPWIEDNKFVIIGNGINDKLFNPKKLETSLSIHKGKIKLIYSSTPFRGLNILLDAFSLIREQVSNSELHICSSMKVYGVTDEEEEPYKGLYDRAKNMEGVVYHGSVKQKELAKLLKEAHIFTYPNIYEETYAICTLESVASKVPIVTTNLGALPETIPKGAAIFVEPYDTKGFADAVIDLIKDKTKYKKMQKSCNYKGKRWEDRSNEWIDTFIKEPDEQYLAFIEKKLKMEELKDECGGNLNTKKYWDEKYTREIEKQIFRVDSNRFKFIEFNTTNNNKILDYGCGKGELLEYLDNKRKDCIFYAYDISKVAIDEVLKINSENNKIIASNNFKSLKIEDKLDTIICSHTIEHLDNPEDTIHMFLEMIKPFGEIILIIPYNDIYWPEHQKVYKDKDIHILIEKARQGIDCYYDINIRETEDFGEEAIVVIRLENK